jgi:putative PIG3 family NAD(P)H quinone oxidoreductase
MKQRFIQHLPNQSLQICEQPLRDIGDGEVLIQVAAFGINRPDLLQKAGQYPAPTDASPILGLEVAGTVIRCGKQVTQWREGMRVCALVNGGGYSDLCFAPANQCMPWPSTYSDAEAACLPESFLTVWHNVFQRGHIQRGDNFLVHAGSSGIGTTAIQLASLAGAHVFTTAGSAEKCARCTTLGATLALNYQQENWLEQFLIATEQHGMDVTLDILGGSALAQHIKLAAIGGRIVNIAVMQSSKAEINLAAIMLKRLTVTGSTLRAQSNAQKAAIVQDAMQRAWHWIERGEFRPIIDSTYSFDATETAHQRMQSREHFGKIAVIVAP